MNLNTMYTSRGRIEDDRKNNLKKADDLTKSAETHRANGNDIQADSDEHAAAKCRDYANQLDTQLAALMLEIERRENKLQDIEDQKAELEKQFKKDMDKLDNDYKLAA